jgi:hypothetical protein
MIFGDFVSIVFYDLWGEPMARRWKSLSECEKGLLISKSA